MVEQDKKVKFLRVDASVDALKGDGETGESEKLTELFKKILPENVKLRFEALKDESIPALLTVSEESRRFGDMMRLYGMGDNIPKPDGELILNTGSSTLSLLEKKYETDPEGSLKTAKQIYMLSALSQRGLDAEELKEFLLLSYESIGEGIK
jgi:molecular chaperone HtpG